MDQPIIFNFTKKRKSLVSLTAREKLQILNELDVESGCNIMKIADKYGISSSTLRKWKKNRAKIEATYEISANSKRCKWSPNKCLNDAVFLWYQKMRSRGILVSGTVIKEKAISFHKKIGGSENFVASTGWLDWWKKKYNVRIIGSRIPTNSNAEVIAAEQWNNNVFSEEKLDNLIIDQALEEAKNYENFAKDSLSMENNKKSSPELGKWPQKVQPSLDKSKNEDIKQFRTIVWLKENLHRKEMEDLQDAEEITKKKARNEEDVVTVSEALEGLHKLLAYCKQNKVINETEVASFQNLRLILESKLNSI